MRTVLAFLKRDFLTSTSYRTSFVMQFSSIFFQAALFFFVAQVFGTAVSPALQPYGGNYFAFLLIGIAFMDYLTISLGAFSGAIRDGQTNGTLEIMLLSPTALATVLLASSLWGYLFSSLRVLLYLSVGIVLFGMDLGKANVFLAAVFLLISIACYASVGIISASFIMVLKKGDPVVWIFGAFSSLLGGVFYPLAVLPDWLQLGSRFLPLTYSLNGMRLALLQGSSLGETWLDLLALVLFATMMLPLGLWSFRFAVRRAKIDGSLAQY